METIKLPEKFKLITGPNKNQSTLIVEPLYPGFGTTVGNALRRVLLSSLPGAAVTAVKIKGVTHEFTTIPMVKEDVLDIILNLKQLRMRIHPDEPVRMILKAKGEKKVTAEDIEAPAEVEITNPELLIATLTHKDAELEMEIIANTGRGYVTVEERPREKELGLIAVDSIYTPIRNVGYKVEDVRVGPITNFDKLTLNIETDGTINPREAVEQAANIAIEHLSLFKDLSGVPVEAVSKPVKAKKEIEEKPVGRIRKTKE